MIILMILMQMWCVENYNIQGHQDIQMGLLLAKALVQYGLMMYPAHHAPAQRPLCTTVLTLDLVSTTVDMEEMLESHVSKVHVYTVLAVVNAAFFCAQFVLLMAVELMKDV